MEEKVSSERESSISYYIFEFHQGHVPQVLWNYGSQIEDVNGLMWYAVTTPAVQESNLDNTKPSTLHSSYKNNDFVAFYELVPDVEARGFTRTVCICALSSTDINAISSNTDFENRVLELFQSSVEKAYPVFKKEMEKYVGSLQATIKASTANYELLKNIEDEITNVIKNLDITPDTTQEEQAPEKFTQINNDLRDVTSLFGFDELIKGLTEISNDTLYSSEIARIHKYAYYKESKLGINFGGITGEKYPSFVSFAFKHKKETKKDRFTLVSLLKSRNFQHIVFSILSGIPFIIESRSPEAMILARKFSAFVPCFEESSLVFINEENVKTSKISSIGKSIIICLSLEKDCDQSFAILNLNKCYYEGPLCPFRSFVFTELSPATNNEASFLLLVFSRLKELSTKFVSVCETLASQNISDMDAIYKLIVSCGFNEFDFLVLQYWTSCLAKYENISTIQMPKSAPLPEGIVAYFEE